MMFMDARTGEGVTLDSKPRKVRSTPAQDRLLIFAVWANLRSQGRSYRRIAKIVNRPLGVVFEGIAEYHAFVARSKALLTPTPADN